MNTIKSTIATISPIDLTPAEAEMLGFLTDIIVEHMNFYELSAKELHRLESGMEIVERLYSMAKGA